MFSKQGLTALELIVVLVIIGTLAGIGVTGWQRHLEDKYTENAKSTLQMIWQAEENFFAWKDNYTYDWNVLEIDNPNKEDKFYDYTLEQATSTNLLIRATRKGTARGFTINQDNEIKSF